MQTLLKMGESGAGMIGGCCGISPEHLKVTKARLSG